MPKQEPVEVFKITAEVEAVELGPTVAALARLGLTNIGYELVTEIRTFNKKTQHETKAEDFLAAWIVDHPSFQARDAIQAFRDDGRTDGAGYSALRTLIGKAILTKTSAGGYARADVKQLAPPAKKTKTPEAAPDENRKTYDIPASELILRHARRNHGRFTTRSATKVVAEDGRRAASASPAIDRLLKRGVVKRIGDGQYELVSVTKKKPAAKAAPVVNGHDVTEGNANG